MTLLNVDSGERLSLRLRRTARAGQTRRHARMNPRRPVDALYTGTPT